MAQYVKFLLTSGDSAPSDGKCLGIFIPGTNYLVWVGADGDTFPENSLTHSAMSQAEIDSVQPAELLRLAAYDDLTKANDHIMSVIHAVVLLTLDQLNTLRALHSLSTLTKAQALSAIQNKLTNGSTLNN